MLKSKFFLILIICALITFNVRGQDLKRDLLAINYAYKNSTSFSVTLNINMFEDYTSQKIYYKENGKILKKEKSTYQIFGETESLITPEYAIILDKEDKQISYSGRKTQFDTQDASFILDIDSIKLFSKKVSFQKEPGGMYSYDFIMLPDYPGYERLIITFNPKNFFIQKITYFCNEDDISINNEAERLAKARVEVTYDNISIKPGYSASDFTYEKYLVKKGKIFELKPHLKDYELHIINF